MLLPTKIPVALVITELEQGGAEKAIVELALRMDRERFLPVIYSLRSRKYHSEHSFIPVLQEAGVEVQYLNMRSALDFFSAVWRLQGRLLRQKAMVVQSYMFHANFVARYAAKRACVPVICSGIRVAEQYTKWHLTLDRFSAKKVDRWVCVSDSVAEYTRDVGGIPEDRTVVINNGIAVAESQPGMEPGVLDGWGKKNIVFAGRLTRQKGIDWLLETVPHWLDSSPDWHLWIIGDGEDAATLKRAASLLTSANRIHFPSWQPNIPRILRSADLVVLPSRWEGMPNLILEAMAEGRPVLSTLAHGVHELLGPQFDAQTCWFGETGQWSEKIIRLIRDESLRNSLGKANYLRALSDFSIDAKIRQYENLWLDLLKEKESFEVSQ